MTEINRKTIEGPLAVLVKEREDVANNLKQATQQLTAYDGAIQICQKLLVEEPKETLKKTNDRKSKAA